MILSVLGQMDSHDSDSGYFGKHRIEEVKSRLSSEGINSIGIWGMGGSGKTTLARKVFDQISNNFAGLCFLENVRDRAQKAGLNQLQEQMLCKLLRKAGPNESPLTIYDDQTVFRLSRISVLIVLDDVSDARQVEKVIGDWRKYGRGSKMIATSRDLQVLKNVCDDVYEVEMLDDNDSLQLLQHHMFKQRQPTAEQIELLRETRQYAQGLPLSLVILGCRLYDKSVGIWRSDLENLRAIPDLDIMNILRSSFDELDDIHKRMFLDIACLLHCSSGGCVDIRQACGFGSGTCRKRKRKIEVISPEMSIGRKIKLQPDVFKDMGRLRILCLRNGCAENILMLQGLKYLPNELRYLEWKNYPLASLPSHFDPENLVELRMRDSNLRKLWSGKPYLPKLKCIDLSESKKLSQLPDLSGALKLERLEVQKCYNIRDIPGSVKHLVELEYLDLSFTELARCPELSQFKKLEQFALENCWNITELPQLPENLIHLNLMYTKIKELPRGTQHLSQLKRLLCECCKELESLPSNIGELENLKELSISGCSKVRSLPTSVGLLHSLVKLTANSSGITCLPDEMKHLANLEELDLSNCTNLESLPEGIKYLTHLEKFVLHNCMSLRMIPELPCKLGDLNATNCTSLVKYAPRLSPGPRWSFWFLFFNCTSLQGDAMNHIFEDFILAVSSVLKIESQYNRGADDDKDEEEKEKDGDRDDYEVDYWNFELVLPGSEFPEGWFNSSSSGGQMGCKSFLANTSWRSVADPVVALIFGVVLAFLPNPNFRVDLLRVKCVWRSESGQVLLSHSLGRYGITAPGECCTVLWLHLVNPSMFCFPETSFRFSVYNGWNEEDILRDDVEILKCGVAPINGSSNKIQ